MFSSNCELDISIDERLFEDLDFITELNQLKESNLAMSNVIARITDIEGRTSKRQRQQTKDDIYEDPEIISDDEEEDDSESTVVTRKTRKRMRKQ